MTTNEITNLTAVAFFDPRTMFREDGVTLRDAAELRTLPGVERVTEDAAGVHVKLRDRADALFELTKYLTGIPDG